MPITATRRPTGPCRAELERFRPLNDANVESTDARRLALVGSLFPATGLMPRSTTAAARCACSRR